MLRLSHRKPLCTFSGTMSALTWGSGIERAPSGKKRPLPLVLPAVTMDTTCAHTHAAAASRGGANRLRSQLGAQCAGAPLTPPEDDVPFKKIWGNIMPGHDACRLAGALRRWYISAGCIPDKFYFKRQ